MRVGLTGGVGAGKSTVAKLLAEHGAIVIDADAIAREVVEPGTPGFAAVVGEFGDGVVGPDGALDRPKLAGIVFADEAQRGRLNAIVHPLVGERTAQLMAAAPEGAVVVSGGPLRGEGGLAGGFVFARVVEGSEPPRPPRLAERGIPEDAPRR